MTTITEDFTSFRAAERARAALHKCEECGAPAQQRSDDFVMVQGRLVEVDAWHCFNCAADICEQQAGA